MSGEILKCSACGKNIRETAEKCEYCGKQLKKDIDSGQLESIRAALKDKYEILGEIGRGGMAIVYKARDIGLDRIVALKVLPDNHLSDREFVERFLREAKISAKLTHPNIVTIHQVGQQDGRYYFAMNYIEGEDLSELITRENKLSVDRTLSIMRDVCDALEYAHRHNVIHRDIKSENIIISKNGNAIVTDFGIARASEGTRITQTGISIGTPEYMSPEQAKGEEKIGQTSDIYSAGIVLYEMLTGKVPFSAATPLGVAMKHVQEVPGSPRNFDSSIPVWLESVILKCLSKKPEDRYQQAGDLKRDLRIPDSNPEKVKREKKKTIKKESGQKKAKSQKRKPKKIESDFSVKNRKKPEKVKKIGKLRLAVLIFCFISAVCFSLAGMYQLQKSNEMLLPTGKEKWRYKTKGSITSSVYAAGGTIYAGSNDKYLYALTAGSGKLKWKAKTNGSVSNPCRKSRIVYAGSGDNFFYAFNVKNGSIKWRLNTGGVSSKPCIINGHLFFQSYGNYIYSLNSNTGKINWKFKMGWGGSSVPVSRNGILYVGSRDFHIYSLDSGSGKLIWKYRTEGEVRSSPSVYAGMIYVGSDDGFLYAIIARTGKLRWKKSIGKGIVSTSVISKGILFFGSHNNFIYAVSRDNGKTEWKYRTGGSVSSPAIDNGVLYAGSQDGYLYSLDCETGALRWKFKTNGPISGGPAVYKGIVYFGSYDGFIYGVK